MINGVAIFELDCNKSIAGKRPSAALLRAITLILEPARQILASSHDADIRKNAAHVETNSLRLLNMVNELLDLAKLESKSIALDIRNGDLEELIRENIYTFTPLAEKLGIDLILTLDSDIPGFQFDPAKTELIFNNLISNALKFTPKNGRIEVDIKGPKLLSMSSPKDPQSFIQITVKDTGIGIPSEEIERIFDRFYQVPPKDDSPDPPQSVEDRETSKFHSGTGIGLAICKEFATLMGGGIKAESIDGEGATFTFWIPFIESMGRIENMVHPTKGYLKKVHDLKESENTPIYKVDPTNKPIALVVEDNPELREFIKQSISGSWLVEEASNGQDGIQSAIELIPDLIISDLMMPVKDGFELCQTLKEHELTAHIPIILLTARANLDSKLGGLRIGADDYLTKPFHTEELLIRMSNLLEMRHKLKQIFSNFKTSAGDLSMVDSVNGLTEPDTSFLLRFYDTINDNLDNENLGVEDFAQKLFISRSQLHRKLKAITDLPATDCIRDFRLEKAMEMLKDRSLQVGEVAAKVGYSNVKYFSTIFKAKYGIPPSKVA